MGNKKKSSATKKAAKSSAKKASKSAPKKSASKRSAGKPAVKKKPVKKAAGKKSNPSSGGRKAPVKSKKSTVISKTPKSRSSKKSKGKTAKKAARKPAVRKTISRNPVVIKKESRNINSRQEAVVKAKGGKKDDIPNSTVALLLVLTLVLMLWSSVVFIQNIKLINAAPFNSSNATPASSGGAMLRIDGPAPSQSSQATVGFKLIAPPGGQNGTAVNQTNNTS